VGFVLEDVLVTEVVPAIALAWTARAVGPDATIEQVQPLPGGTHAATHLIRTANPARETVLRRFPAGDTAARDEAAALTALDGLGGWAPRLIDVDTSGKRAGQPATLITRVAGRPNITPADPHAAATELGKALARVHATPLAAWGSFRDGVQAAISAATPTRSTAPGAPALLARENRLTRQPPVLTHYDYWTGNVLWQGDAITGVIDWAGAARAPRGFDVSWCRLDLVLLHDHATRRHLPHRLPAGRRATGPPPPAVGPVRPDQLLSCGGNLAAQLSSPRPHGPDQGRSARTPHPLDQSLPHTTRQSLTRNSFRRLRSTLYRIRLSSQRRTHVV
jgi:aminoglycoside phosphotransferase (APT) family kinase protein